MDFEVEQIYNGYLFKPKSSAYHCAYNYKAKHFNTIDELLEEIKKYLGNE